MQAAASGPRLQRGGDAAHLHATILAEVFTEPYTRTPLPGLGAHVARDAASDRSDCCRAARAARSRGLHGHVGSGHGLLYMAAGPRLGLRVRGGGDPRRRHRPAARAARGGYHDDDGQPRVVYRRVLCTAPTQPPATAASSTTAVAGGRSQPATDTTVDHMVPDTSAASGSADPHQSTSTRSRRAPAHLLRLRGAPSGVRRQAEGSTS